MRTLDATSRYRFTVVHGTGSEERFGPWMPPAISLSGATQHAVEPHEVGRLDNLANKFWRNPRYWWVLAFVNNIHQPLRDMTAGMMLTVPTLDAIESALSAQRVSV